MKMIAGQTEGWLDTEIYFDGNKLEQCFEADDELGKAWVYSEEYPGYKVLKGVIEFKTKPAVVNMHNHERGDNYQVIYCSSPDCAECSSLRNMKRDWIKFTADRAMELHCVSMTCNQQVDVKIFDPYVLMNAGDTTEIYMNRQVSELGMVAIIIRDLST